MPTLGWASIWRVFLGGSLGTLLRLLVLLLLPSHLAALFIVNLAGSAFLGYANGSKRFDSDAAGSFWKVGFAGGFTTMSALAMITTPVQPASILVAVTMLITGVAVYLLVKRASR